MMKQGCCYECHTGEPPRKQPDMPIEVIEEEMRRLRSPAKMDELGKWLDTRPPRVQQMARDFPQFQLYLVKEPAPYRYTVAGSIVSPYSFTESEKTGRITIKFVVLRSPVGHTGVIAEIDPCWVKPITLDDLKEMVKESNQ